jgi:hypothetical protein
MKPQTHTVDMIEGPEAFERFREAAKKILSVKKSDLPASPSGKRRKKKVKDGDGMGRR